MIIECPACATRYQVPDGSIGSAGRNVRCAKCKHSWHATAVEEADVDAVPAPVEPALARKTADRSSPRQQERGAGARKMTEEPRAEPRGGGEPRDGVLASRGPATAGRGAAGSAGAGTSSDAEPLVGSRRARPLWTWAALILAIMVAAAVAAIAFWGLPDWVPGGRQTVAAEPELVLDFPDDQQGMRQLANGTEFFGARGTITNTGSDTKRVPPILVVLRDSRERIVYSFEVVPPKHSLAPGESMAVSEAVTEVPRSARVADIGWKPG